MTGLLEKLKSLLGIGPARGQAATPKPASAPAAAARPAQIAPLAKPARPVSAEPAPARLSVVPPASAELPQAPEKPATPAPAKNPAPSDGETAASPADSAQEQRIRERFAHLSPEQIEEKLAERRSRTGAKPSADSDPDKPKRPATTRRAARSSDKSD